MVGKPLTIFLIVFYFISSVFSAYEEETITITDGFNHYGQGSTSYKMKLANGYSLNKYTRIKITKITKGTPNLLIFISKNQQCSDDRIAMGVQTYESINLFFLKDHYDSNNGLYLCVKCQSENENNCNYNIDIYTESELNLNIGDQISYYVDQFSKKIDFKIINERASNLRHLETLYDYVNFWIKGQDIIRTALKSSEGYQNEISFGYGNMYIDDGLSEYYSLSVESKEGDFVTVGSLGIYDKITQELKLNDLEIMGILDKNVDRLCFPLLIESEPLDDFKDINIAQVNGIVYTKKASIYTPLQGSEDEVEGIEDINDGLIFKHISIDEKSRSFCIKYREKDNNNKNIIFSLQFTSAAYKNYDQYIITPQLPGVIYSHFLPKGAIGVYRGMKVKNGGTEINYNMKSIKGYPDMYFNRAIDFPVGQYRYEDLNNFDNPHHANRMSVYNFYLYDEKFKMFRDFNNLTPKQPLIIVYCLKGDNEVEMNSKYCQFETSIFSNVDRVNLIEKKTFSQYLLENEQDSYTINIENEDNLYKVYLDVIVFTGDVNCEIETKGIKDDAHKYYLSNKIFFSYTVKSTDKQIDFTVKAQKNSFYLVIYELVRNDDESKNTNMIDSGFNYIQSIFIGDDADYFKYIEIENTKYEEQSDFLISLYSQNCQFVVSRNIINEDGKEEEEYLHFYDSYSQLIIDKDDSFFNKKKYKFRVDVIGDDISTYSKKLCMIYVTGLEISNSENGSERTISVTEGVPQYFIFTNDHPFIKYTYFVSDIDKEVIINFNLPDKGTFNVKIIHHYNDIKDEEKIFRNCHIVITKEDLKSACNYDDEVCPIDIFIRAETVEKERKLETIIYQVNGAPIYLEKNAIKQDILFSSVKKRYYLDVGPEEEGEITIDYIRGSGYIYADIARKNENKALEGSDWRGVYKFPTNKEESSKITYETYLKQLKITKSITDNEFCEFGCYILITVVNSVYEETKDSDNLKLVPYRITITPRILPKGYETSEYLIPKVKMSVNQFVIGNIYESKELITSYYQVNLPYESEYVIFDWQADSPTLFIDVGEERPGIQEEDHDFYFPSVGHDNVIRITKEEILKFAKENRLDIIDDDSIRNIKLTLGIWTNTTDTLYTSIYAFKIFMPPVYINSLYERNVIEIIHIRSDQKVQCKPLVEKGKYSCLFAVIFDEGDIGKSLVVYPRAQVENLQVSFTGSLVDAEEIERNDLAKIVEYMENPDDQFSSRGGKKYIYYGKIEKGQSLLFSVEVEQESIIEVLSSIYTYTLNQTFVPNPSTPQVFALGNKTILFNFETTKDLLINFVSISGTGNFYWEDDAKFEKRYFMTGFEDRLTLTSGDFKHSLKKLVAQATTATAYEPDDSGFVFYISFYPRNTFHNIDQVKVGRSTEINYRDVKFPLSFFTKLSDNDISISFTFYNYYMDPNYTLRYDHPMFNIWGKVISEKEALKIRLDGIRPPNDKDSVKGIFDGAFGSLFLNSKQIQQFKVPEEENPYLFFSIDLKEGQEFQYNGISMELSILREQTDNDFEFFAPENVYLNGKLSNSQDTSSPSFVYKLKIDHNKKYMRVEFAANSDYVKWDVCKDEGFKEKIDENDELDFEYLNGRNLFTFRIPDDILEKKSPIYLHVYKDVNLNVNPQLTNYIFKYMNAEYKETFFSFPQEKDIIEYSIKENPSTKNKKYTISFIPFDFYYVNYYVKAVYKDGRIPGERTDTIAISEADGFYLQIDNPDIEEGKRYLTFEIPNNKDISYIKIWAKINLLLLNEYILYKPLEIENSDDEDFPVVEFEDVSKSGPFSFTYNDETRQVKLDCKNVKNIQNYEISFKNKEMPNYLKIIIRNKNEENSDINKILYFSHKKDAKENRVQLAQTGGEYSVSLWIRKEDIESNMVYATVECQTKLDCSYFMEFKGYRYILMDTSLFSYNYYVSKKSESMTFSIKNDLQISDTNDQILTLYANGGKNIRLTLGNCIGEACLQHTFRTGAAITTKIQSHNYFELTVEATEGDYISVGSKVTFSDGRSFENVLKPNGYSITGYLTKILLPKECYTLPAETTNNKNSYIIGTFYDRIAQISFKDKNFQDITEKGTQEIITTGFYSYTYNPAKETKRGYICIEFPKNNNYDIKNIPYSLQLIQPSENVGLKNFFSPQLSGSIYQRIIPKGSTVFFTGANYNVESDDIIYNMMSTEGSPKMYIFKCTNYPLCDEVRNNLIEINEMNRMSTWHNKDEDRNNSPIDKNQYVMVVDCEDNDDSTYDVCQFQTSIYGNKDEIYLIEGQSFSQYISKGKSTKYIIDYSSEKSATKIHVDTLVMSGDVSFDLKTEKGGNVTSHKYYLANKIFYSVHLDEPENAGLKRIIVEINAKVNSYYIIEYKIARGLQSELSNDIYERINYLIPFSPKIEQHKKTVRVHNRRLLNSDNYLVNFYSLNCDFEILKKNIDGEISKIIFDNNYGSDLINQYADDMTQEFYSYDITASDTDLSNYETKMCMLYVSGIQISKDENNQKEILMGEGIPQRISFNDYINTIKFIYPIVDESKSLAIFYKVITAAEYSVFLQFKNSIPTSTNFSQSFTDYIDNTTLYCSENELCNIIISISAKEIDLPPVLEVTIRQLDNVPYYIPKGVVKQDFVSGDTWLNLFTTLGKDDEGYITLDFARGSGEVYAKIVQFEDEGDKDPDWRQFKFPREQEGTLKYQFYNEKLVFSSVETNKCVNGCYLLISIRSSTTGHLDAGYRVHQFSITVGLYPRGSSAQLGQIIKIEPEEFVIGSLTNRKNSKEMYEYYQITIPYDSDSVEFDWQSDSAILLINVKDSKPSKDEPHFKLESRSDTVFEISKDKIVDKGGLVNNDIMNVQLTIAVYSDYYESFYGTPYSFRVHFKRTEKLNIHKITSDQKTLCKPIKYDKEPGNYNCLFMIIFGELDFIYDLMIYSKSQNPSAITYMYGKFIQNSIYDEFKNEKLENEIPTNDVEKLNTKKLNLDFIFITLSDLHSHLFINVVSDKPDIIELITSFKTFDMETSPNPSSVQLFAINNADKMKLKFVTTKPLLINIVSLYGSTRYYFENDEEEIKYILRGRDDRISLAIPSTNKKESILIVENNNPNNDDDSIFPEEGEMSKPKMAFYLDYYMRSIEMNLDEIYLGKTDEYAYKKSDFPLYYYSKIGKEDNSINAFFILHDIVYENNNNEQELSSSDIQIKGNIIDQKTVYLLKTNDEAKPEINDSPMKGIYDPAIQVGQIFFPEDNIKDSKKQFVKPTLYLSLEKPNSNNKIKKMRVELAAIQENCDVPVTEKLYQYGKIKEKDTNTYYYRLKVDRSNEVNSYMRIQFSTNSKNIDFAINKNKNSKNNDTFIGKDIKVERGKVFITFERPKEKEIEYIYLNVFLKNKIENTDIKSNNYVFKYINSNEKDKFFEYKIRNDDPTIIKELIKDEYVVKFNGIEYKKDVNILYSLKGVEEDNYEFESFDTIALTDSSSNVIQVKDNNKDAYELRLKKGEHDLKCFQVLAQIRDGPITEYVAYKSIVEISPGKHREKKDSGDGDDDKTTLYAIIGISVGLLVIVAVLVVIILIYNARNKDLMDQVQKISFVKSGAKPKDDLNLLLDNQNELE